MRPKQVSRGVPLTRETLAVKLRQNWLAKNPIDSGMPLDDSLTSLNWLQNLNIMKFTGPTPPGCSPGNPLQPISQFSSNTQVNPNAVLNMTNFPNLNIKQEPQEYNSVSQFRTIAGIEIAPPLHNNPLDKINYKMNPHVKPPYSYATLICMAMRESKKNKITLSGIYNWITENFMYYRNADPSWQNSIRHNLSLNKCFQKVARRKDEPGKGGFWRINPEYEDMFVNGIFKKRRCSTVAPSPVMPVREPCVVLPPPKRIKKEHDDEDSNSSITSLSGLATVGAIPGLLTPMTSLDETQEAVNMIEIKREPMLYNSGEFRSVVNAEITDTDFSWNAILNQDIDVGGVRVKTEQIIDQHPDDGIASPITALSPPPSDSNSDISLEDLLGSHFDNPLDLTTGSVLDLTVSGIGLKAPDWWAESFSDRNGLMSPGNCSRISTPVAPIDDSDFAHPWAEDKTDSENAMASFGKDFGNLFDILDHIPTTSDS